MTTRDTRTRSSPAEARRSRRRGRTSAAAWLDTAGVLLAAAGCSGGRPVAVPGALAGPGATSDCLAQAVCYTPLEFRVAYGAQPLVQRGIDGRGQAVVLIELPSPGSTSLREDIARYDSRFGLQTASVAVYAAAGSHASASLAGGEEVEDAETVHAIAPDAAIRILDIGLARQAGPAQLAAALAAGLRQAAGGTSAAAPLWAALIASRPVPRPQPGLHQPSHLPDRHKQPLPAGLPRHHPRHQHRALQRQDNHGIYRPCRVEPRLRMGHPRRQYLIPLLATYAASSQRP
jgi:hypothetical protein